MSLIIPNNASPDGFVTPAALASRAALSIWLAWCLNEGRKIPYSSTATRGRSTDPATWRTLEAALGVRAFQREQAAALGHVDPGGGVGLVLGSLGAITPVPPAAWDGLELGGVDLDSCLDAEGRLSEWADTACQILGGYRETSPSGRGRKIIFTYRAEDRPALLTALGVSDHRMGRTLWRGGAAGGKAPGIEAYLSGHYFAVTGLQVGLGGDALATIGEAELRKLATLARQLGGRAPGGGRAAGGGGAAPTDDNAPAVTDAELTGWRAAVVAPEAIQPRVTALAAQGGDFARWWAEGGPVGHDRSLQVWHLVMALRGAGGDPWDEPAILSALMAHDAAGAWIAEKGWIDNGRQLKRLLTRVPTGEARRAARVARAAAVFGKLPVIARAVEAPGVAVVTIEGEGAAEAPAAVSVGGDPARLFAEVAPLVDALCGADPIFATVWRLGRIGDAAGGGAGTAGGAVASALLVSMRRAGWAKETCLGVLRAHGRARGWLEVLEATGKLSTLDRAWREATPPEPPAGWGDDPRPLLLVSSDVNEPDAHQLAVRAVAALTAGDNMHLFTRGGAVLAAPRIEKSIDKQGRPRAVPAISDLDVSVLIDRMVQTARWRRRNQQGELVRARPPQDVALTIFNDSTLWSEIRPLMGVTNTPFLRRDGSLCWQDGYDPSSGFILTMDDRLRGIDWTSTIDGRGGRDAAWQMIESLLADVCAVAPVDKSVVLSLFLCSVLRSCMTVMPVHIIGATVVASGKTFLCEAAGFLATGGWPSVMLARSNPEEQEKSIVGALVSDRAVVIIDNVNGFFESNIVAQAASQGQIRYRPMRTLDDVSVMIRALITLNGNNIRVGSDMIRRTVMCNLDPKIERAEQRRFEHQTIPAMVADRGRFVQAVLLLAQDFIARGRPGAAALAPVANHEDYSLLVRGLLVERGWPDPSDSTLAAREADPVKNLLDRVVMHWPDCFPDEPVGEGAVRETWRTLREAVLMTRGHRYHLDATAGAGAGGDRLQLAARALYETFLEIAPARGDEVDARELGKWMERQAKRVSGGRRILRRYGPVKTCLWRVETVT